MPRISEFFGIVILMYWKDTKQHHLPHFHVRYGGDESVFTLDGDIIVGKVSLRVKRLVSEWAKEREKELRYAWDQAVVGKEVPWVTPIK